MTDVPDDIKQVAIRVAGNYLAFNVSCDAIYRDVVAALMTEREGFCMNKYLSTAIERAGRTLDIYERVHVELDNGEEFADIDNGMREGLREISYDLWFQYMEARLTRHVSDIVLSYRAYETPEK